MALFTGLLLIVLGACVWLFGNRMWLLGAATGALLGFGLAGIFPSLAGGWVELLMIVGGAIVLGVLGFIGKAFAKIIAMVIGFIAGGALVIAFFELFSTSSSLWLWIAALIGGLVGAVVFSRFLDLGLIIFASLLGSMLVLRGALTAFNLSLLGTYSTLIVLVLTVLGIIYHNRKK